MQDNSHIGALQGYRRGSPAADGFRRGGVKIPPGRRAAGTERKGGEKVENINVKVHITGLQELEQAVEDVNQKCMELRKSLTGVQAALSFIGCEIVQPPAETDGGM